MADPALLGVPWKRQLWHKWKTLRKIPFRKSWFVGYDLEGNSYWELIDHNNPHRLRRKVSLDRPYFHFSDFKPHPMWMQWLQFTRPIAPTLVDLTNDAKRQYRLRLLAKQADMKWKSVPLKSDQTVGSDDPRIGSAWSGNAEPKNNSGGASLNNNAESEHMNDGATEQESPSMQFAREAQLKAAMEKAEMDRKNAPKITRDDLGQVKIHRNDGPNKGMNNTTNTANDDPVAASFKPKSRS